MRQINVLIVEDNRLNQIVLKSKLKQWNHEVFIANDGEEAIEIFKNEDIDFIFMDLMMPGYDGYETATIIREISTEVPIVAVSANFESYSIEKCLQHGMNDYISKPIDNYQLEKVLLKYIDH